uniref:F-box domain-containing protein n=1 Tax=Oryza punctata TaxID=4537 RepID=A0A0E0KNI1_ORYPU
MAPQSKKRPIAGGGQDEDNHGKAMDSHSKKRRIAGGGDGEDRISELPDDLLGHILSFLPNNVAARTAVLSRRWRYIFAYVHTISFEEEEGEREDDWITLFSDAEEKKSMSRKLLDQMNAALLCRRRCAGRHVPLRSFHFAFDSYHQWDRVIVDAWVNYVVRHSSQELHLDLRFWIGPICGGGGGERHRFSTIVDSEPLLPGLIYDLPRSLYSCVALQTLCLTYCDLNLPESIDLPFLKTMRLTGIHGSGSRIQRLISSCPRLADLTLEALGQLKTLSLLDKGLRSFALLCCHNVDSVAIDASELTTIAYRGTVPDDPSYAFSMLGSPAMSSCTVDFCSKELITSEEEFDSMRRFLAMFAGSTHLHLESDRLGSCIDSDLFPAAGFRTFTNLRRLELTGHVPDCGVAIAVRRILEMTPNLESLTLFLKPEKCNSTYCDSESDGSSDSGYISHSDDDDDTDVDDYSSNIGYNSHCDEDSDDSEEDSYPAVASFSAIRCLRRRVREINLVHYKADDGQATLARLLLSNALVLQRVCVVLTRDGLGMQRSKERRIKRWMVSRSAKAVFL